MEGFLNFSKLTWCLNSKSAAPGSNWLTDESGFWMKMLLKQDIDKFLSQIFVVGSLKDVVPIVLISLFDQTWTCAAGLLYDWQNYMFINIYIFSLSIIAVSAIQSVLFHIVCQIFPFVLPIYHITSIIVFTLFSHAWEIYKTQLINISQVGFHLGTYKSFLFDSIWLDNLCSIVDTQRVVNNFIYCMWCGWDVFKQSSHSLCV